MKSVLIEHRGGLVSHSVLSFRGGPAAFTFCFDFDALHIWLGHLVMTVMFVKDSLQHYLVYKLFLF